MWNFDNLERIGGNVVTVVGHPRLVDTPAGKAVEFDGVGDAVVIDANPLAGAKTFTLEAIFRPDDNGSTEPRWFHIQENTGNNRILLEARITKDSDWFLDEFIQSGENGRTLFAEDFTHTIGEWHHVALVFDGAEMRDYVDGKLELSSTLTITPFGPGKTSIGVRMNRVDWFKGAVRAARFTPRALEPKDFMR